MNKARIVDTSFMSQTSEKKRFARRVSRKRLAERIREYIWSYKATHPCRVCGYNKPQALAFHHRDPQTKKKTVGEGKFTSIKKLIAEIEKCDVLCSNCHLELHHTLRQTVKGLP